MRDALFLKNKVNRQIVRNGGVYDVLRRAKDKYGQLSKQPVKVCEIPALYHTDTVKLTKTVTDDSVTTTERSPMLLTLKEYAVNVLMDDVIVINEKSYRVVGAVDVQELGVVYDISLEEA